MLPNHPWINLKNTALFSIVFLGIYLIVEFSPLDLLLQDYIYNFSTHSWPIDRDEKILKVLFYNGPKLVLAILGITALGIFISTFFSKKYHSLKYPCLYFFLSIALVSGIIASMKNFTNTYCPWDVARYGGDQPYVKVLSCYPKDFVQGKKPKCFPGGHASGGFALFCLVFLAKNRKKFLMGLSVALASGWIMGIYQMLKGAHYFTHNLATMFLSWIMCMLLFLAIKKIEIKTRDKKS